MDVLVKNLIEHQVVSEVNDKLYFEPGNKLMDYINFLGCSPSLRSGELDSIITLHHYPEIRGMGGESIETLRYTGCKHAIENPSALITGYPQQRQWTCPQCKHQGQIEQINWRKSAGFACLFFEISGIFPKEALPTDALLALLKESTLSEWQWFYSKSSA